MFYCLGLLFLGRTVCFCLGLLSVGGWESPAEKACLSVCLHGHPDVTECRGITVWKCSAVVSFVAQGRGGVGGCRSKSRERERERERKEEEEGAGGGAYLKL